MRFEPQVSLRGLKPEAAAAMTVCAVFFAELRLPMRLTSVTDGTHGANSYHYQGLAFDIGAREFSAAQRANIRDELKFRLGHCFDVVDEGTHLHVELDGARADRHHAARQPGSLA